MKEFQLDTHTCIGGWFMPERLCDDIIERFNSSKDEAYPGVTGHKDANNEYRIDTNPDIKDSIDIDIHHEHLEKPFEEYRILLQECLDRYQDKFTDAGSMQRYNINEPYNIQYYKPGGGYKIWHFENAGRRDRVLAFMTYLNNVDDGGTEFKYQNLTTPAKKGLTVIWPANWTHTHRGQISKTNEKYIVTGWYSYNDGY